jgi:hypothetical protein
LPVHGRRGAHRDAPCIGRLRAVRSGQSIDLKEFAEPGTKTAVYQEAGMIGRRACAPTYQDLIKYL